MDGEIPNKNELHMIVVNRLIFQWEMFVKKNEEERVLPLSSHFCMRGFEKEFMEVIIRYVNS
jgi:hypothetical protein